MKNLRLLILLVCLFPPVQAQLTDGAGYSYYINQCHYVTSKKTTDTCIIQGFGDQPQQLEVSKGDRLSLSVLNSTTTDVTTILHPHQLAGINPNWTVFDIVSGKVNALLKLSVGSQNIEIRDAYDLIGFVVNVTSLETAIEAGLRANPNNFTDLSDSQTLAFSVNLRLQDFYYDYYISYTTYYFRSNGLLRSYVEHKTQIGGPQSMDFAITPTPNPPALKISAFLPVYVLIFLGIFRKHRLKP